MYGRMKEHLCQTLAEIKEAGLYKEERLIESPQQAAITVKGGEVLNFCANNYLGLSNNPRLIAAAQQMMDRRGYGMSSVRFICGTQDIHKELEAAIKGMLAPKFREVVLGRAEVRNVFKLSSAGMIAGSYVLDGKITRNSQIRVVRDGIVIFEDAIASLKRFKEDAKEVASGYECGVGLEKFNDIKEGDILEAFIMEEVKA